MSQIPVELAEVIAEGRYNIPLFAEKLLGMPTHKGQKKFYKHGRKKINVLTPANRWGKTVTVAIKHIHKNFYKIGIGTGDMDGWLGVDYRTANVSPKASNTEAVFKAVIQILTSRFPIPQPDGSVKNNDCFLDWFYIPERTINTSPFMVYFSNNSMLECRSMGQDKGDSLQGKPYGYISYDEGGRSDHLETEIWDNLLPRLTDWGGELDIPSTPDSNSPSILYHFELHEEGKDPDHPTVYTQEGSIDDNEFLTDNAKEAQKKLYHGKPSAPQVLQGKFVFAGDNIFSNDDIMRCLDEDLNDSIPYQEGHRYTLSIDSSIGGDERVFQMTDVTNVHDMFIVRKKVAKGSSMSPQLHIQDCVELFDSYNKNHNVDIILETFNGESARFYMDLPDYMQRVTICFGTWQPITLHPKLSKKRKMESKKPFLIVAGRKVISEHSIRIAKNDAKLKQQLSIYREDDEKLKQDHVIAFCLVAYKVKDTIPKVKDQQFQAMDW